MPVAMARMLAAREGVSVEDAIAGERYRWRDFTSFLQSYDRIATLLRTPDDYRALAAGYLASIARQGAIYAELTVSPDHARSSGLDPLAYIRAVAAGAQEAERAHVIVARLVVVGVRHFGVASVEAAARLAATCAEPLVTGFGLAGDERAGRPADFAPAFRIARDAGLGLTAHAGEFAGAGAVAETLDALGVSRIGHGVRAVEDRRVVERLTREGVTLEVCPGSNLALGVFGSDDHPLRALSEAGVRVTVSTDDPPFFGTDLAAEYRFAETQGLDPVMLTRQAIEAAFVDAATRQRLLERLVTAALRLGAPPATR
ncbi:adenosine deaminase [Aureimonas jatrophae]|uniref:Adenosine deaminase n=2 Tax=Aureimonas jatrophae TaxID=1166073 RepID=A0A1H0LTD2_9HYPH|nr:adenosine deaminase [Aureimonas jatrophae]